MPGFCNILFLHKSSGNGKALCEVLEGFLAAATLLPLWLGLENDHGDADPTRIPTFVWPLPSFSSKFQTNLQNVKSEY